MKFRTILFLAFLFIISFGELNAQASVPAPARTNQPAPEQSPWYFGGSIGLSFGVYTRVAVLPLVGYNVNERFSVGFRGLYEYIKDKRFIEDYTFNNYGGGLFGRYRFIPQAYAHVEFDYYSYGFGISNTETQREWVPFLYVGGGYIQQLGGNAALFIEVLFDVIQDPNSPYPNWQPLINMGVQAGI